MPKKNDPKYYELKYQRLLKDHKKLAKDALTAITSNQIMKRLIIELAEYMGLEDIGKLTPEQVIESAKKMISR